MSPLRVLRGLIFGTVGGLVAWLLVEFWPYPSPPFRASRFDGLEVPQTAFEIGLLGLAVGLAIGGALGLAEAVSEGTMARARRAFFTFLGLGAVGGFLGLFCGQTAYAMLLGPSGADASMILVRIIARVSGWALLGALLGAVFGVPNLSMRRMWNGLIGGALGGAFGGFIFEVVGMTGFSGTQARFLGFLSVGGAIGFFINLVAEVMKQVWVKVLVGRNEGREFVIDKPVAYVGRDELADVPVFLDPMVPKRMASFRNSGNRYALHPESTALPITINGQPLTPGYVLQDGDAIQFGRVTLAYNEKSTARGGVRPVDRVPLAVPGSGSVLTGTAPIPTSAHVCAFCGTQKDPTTGACACSVPTDGGAPAGYPAPDVYAPADVYGQPVGYSGAAAYGQPGYGPAPHAPVAGPTDATIAIPGGGDPYAGAAAGPQLVVVDGPLRGQVFPLHSAEIGIGRDAAQDIPLTGDSTASRRHARLCYTPQAWVLRDEGSANGTWVNGVRIQEQPVFTGDVIRIGQTQFRFDG